MQHNTKTYRPAFSDFSVIIVFLVLVILGAALLPLLNIRLYPSRTLPSITVSYNWYDASPRVIEQKVTSPLEGMLGGMEGLEHISSVSRKGNGRITLKFSKHTDMDMARFNASCIIRRAYNAFPPGVTYPVVEVSTGNDDVKTLMTWTLNGHALPSVIQDYANDHIVPEMSGIRGVNNIEVYGATGMEWVITLNQGLMQSLKIDRDEVVRSIRHFFREEALGITRAHAEAVTRYNVLLRTKMQDSADPWHDVPVARAGSRIIMLTDLATIKKKEQPPSGYYRINGLNTINVVLYSAAGINELRTGKAVHEKMQEIGRSLPPGYGLINTYDTTAYIAKEMKKTAFRSILSLIFLMVFVLLVSRRWKYVLLITVSLLANLVIAVLLYHLLSLEIHLYSLAGITVSFGIIIDNSIVMIDHYRLYRNRDVFLAVLAATLTTIGSMTVIFFLKEEQKVNLVDFSWVMIANLTVSLFVALFFISSLIEKMNMTVRPSKAFYRRRRMLVRFGGTYRGVILFVKRYRIAFAILLILGFGIPVHWLPEKIEKEGWWAGMYNAALGSDWFVHSARPVLEKVVGGSLRLFSEHVFEDSFYNDPRRTRLYVRARMPEGCTVHQLNTAMEKMENYISAYDEVETFETRVSNYKNGSITITFRPEHESGAFPYHLMGELISKAIHIGGVDYWSIYGVGDGFSNALYSGYKSNQIIFEGYNYDELYQYASLLRDSIGRNARVKDIEITGRVRWDQTLADEFCLDFSPEKSSVYRISLSGFFQNLQENCRSGRVSPVFDGSRLVPVTIVSDQAADFSAWKLRNMPVATEKVSHKVAQLGSIVKKPVGSDIYKENQQYILTVAWDFIGPYKLADRYLDEQEAWIGTVLPIGYKAEKMHYSYRFGEDDSQFYLILLVIGVVFFICSILLESLSQPLAIIGLVPVSFIGVFLTFYLFGFNFDQGGFAAFIMLAGIVVNSGLYIINDYNHFQRGGPGMRKRSKERALRLYMKAYHHKIIPVLLTVFSTVLGLLPFLIGGQKEPFWFSFAVGTIGGLLFSLIAIVFFFPLFIRLHVKNIK